MIRPVTCDDADFLIGLAKDRYPAFDESLARAWVAQVTSLADHSVFFRRTDNGAILAQRQETFFSPKPEVHMLFWAARPNRTFEGFRLMASMIEWARAMGASAHFGEQTGVDLSPYAKRLGAVLDRPSWTVEG